MDVGANSGEDFSDTIEAWNLLYDAIFKSSNSEEPFELPEDSPLSFENLQCFIDYKIGNIEALAQVGLEIRQCVNVSLKDLEHYFRRHSFYRLRKHLSRDIVRCRRKSDDNDSYLDCFADVVSFKSI